MTTHPAREAGQRWAYDYDGVQSSMNPRRFILTKRDGDTWYATDEAGRESCFAYENEFREVPHMFCLVSSPSASPASGPPVGYKQCDRKCGRWVPAAFGNCTTCWKALGNKRVNPACIDWTPPLESKPAETGKLTTTTIDRGYCCPNAATGFVYHSRGCHNAQAEETGRPAQVHDPRCVLDRDHKGGCKWPGMNASVQEAPKACANCRSTYGTHVTTFEAKPFCGPCFVGLQEWMGAQSGTPYAGPERLPVRPMSFAPFDDDFAGDVR